MDFLEFVCVMTLILTSGLLIFVKMSTNAAIKQQELAEKLQRIQKASDNAKRRYEVQDEDIAPWATELISALGISPESLFQDEIPK
jgi:hypothetical protein